MRLFGWIAVDDTHALATRFVHVAGLPIWPGATELVDTSTITVERGRKRHLLSTTVIEHTQYRAQTVPHDRRSVLAAYLRTWGALVACIGIAGVLHAQSLAIVGGVVFVVGRGFSRFAFLRVGNLCSLVGVGLIVGGLGGYLVRPVWTGSLVAIGLLATAATWSWRTKPPVARRADGRAAAKLPRAVVIEQAASPAMPAVTPIASQAPERIEPSSDTPRFLA
jgi:hypothetical protein